MLKTVVPLKLKILVEKGFFDELKVFRTAFI